MQLELIQMVDEVFHSVVVFCEERYSLITVSSTLFLYWHDPLISLYFLIENNIYSSTNIFIAPRYI